MKKIKFIVILLMILALLSCTLSANKQRTPKWFKGNRIVQSYTLIYNSSVEKIFPLLCPVREYEWMTSWQGTIVYAKSGFAEKYVVFYHSIPFPFLFKKAYWTATQYLPNKQIQWAVTVPGICIIIIDEYLEQLGENQTKIDSKYTITGVSKLGNKVIEKMFTEANLLKELNRSKDEIEYYIKTGKMLNSKYTSKMFD